MIIVMERRRKGRGIWYATSFYIITLLNLYTRARAMLRLRLLYANTLIGLRNIITHKGMVPSDVIDSPHLIF
jgi:hypothetical protein